MNTKDLIEEVLGTVTDALMMLQSGELGWRWLKGQIRRRIWRPYLKPAIRNLDTSWVPEVLEWLVLVRILLRQFMADEEFRAAVKADPESALRGRW